MWWGSGLAHPRGRNAPPKVAGEYGAAAAWSPPARKVNIQHRLVGDERRLGIGVKLVQVEQVITSGRNRKGDKTIGSPVSAMIHTFIFAVPDRLHFCDHNFSVRSE